jgi:hypothetical protein
MCIETLKKKIGVMVESDPKGRLVVPRLIPRIFWGILMVQSGPAED